MLAALLATSAVQLYETDPLRPELLIRASYLQSTALTLAKPHCTSLGQDESIGMLFSFGFTAIFSLAEGSVSSNYGPDNPINPLDKLVQSFQLVRGIRVLLAPHWQYLATSWAGPILSSSMAAGSECEAQPPYSHAEEYRALRSLAFGLDDLEQRRSCLKAIDDVFRYIHALEEAEDR
ncbi:hypothetical protein B0A55_08105 [Friedmanniomyces simplex]|uniref:Transcription factor domain-containing protein n=1 Tax=Friedmanniomyces simplex TaxID=329884 RepID=A0A4U0X227_9PEZI|nr:hypothetical protein B0A55_08105 [Friedmanniomyces simplex]